MSKYDVYGIGNALVDFQFHVSDADLQKLSVDKGVMTLIEEERSRQLLEAMNDTDGLSACGGSAANTLIAMAQLGAKGYYSCKVASDSLGDFYMQNLHSWGVDSNLDKMRRSNGRTGTCVVLVTPDGERSMSTHLGITSGISNKEIDEQALIQSHFLYIEGYLVASDTGIDAALEAKAIAEKNQIKTSLTLSDPNMVNFFKDRMNALVKKPVDLLFSNEQEAMLMAESDTVNDAISYLKGCAKQFAVTCGARGALVWDGHSLHEIGTSQVDVIDTNGAGDMFAGTFLHALTQGESLDKCGAKATKSASYLVTHFGPRLNKEQVDELRTKLN